MIDLRIMNNFPNNEKPAIFENLVRCVREVDGALDAVAETKLLGQAHGGVPDGNHSADAADFFDNITAIVRLDLLLHGRHHVRRAQVHFLAGSCAAGNQVRAHDFGQRNPNWPFSNGRTSAKISLSADNHWSTSSGPGGSLNQLGESNTERGGSGSRL